MRLIYLYFVLYMTLGVTYGVSSNEAIHASNRLLGGKLAPNGFAPYMVSLRHNCTNQHFCGGVIISRYDILTAGHCVSGLRPSYFNVMVGTNSVGKVKGGQMYRVKKILHHPKFNETSSENDIAIISLKKLIRCNKAVKPIPVDSRVIPPGVELLLTGWGLTEVPSNTYPDRLRMVLLKSISNHRCLEELGPGSVTKSSICTYTRPGQGACFADSGGPLVRKKPYVALVGLVSWGKPCGIGKPDVYTRISSYIKWIKDNARTQIVISKNKRKPRKFAGCT